LLCLFSGVLSCTSIPNEENNVAFYVPQLEALIKKTLHDFDPELSSPGAVKLLLGTGAQESHLGTYMRQLKGPAVGMFQMEPDSFEWLQVKYAEKYPQLVGRGAPEMEWDLKLAIIMARLRYRADIFDIPSSDDLPGIAAYWKRVYNTKYGKGTEAEFIANYKRFVEGEEV